MSGRDESPPKKMDVDLQKSERRARKKLKGNVVAMASAPPAPVPEPIVVTMAETGGQAGTVKTVDVGVGNIAANGLGKDGGRPHDMPAGDRGAKSAPVGRRRDVVPDAIPLGCGKPGKPGDDAGAPKE